MKKDAGDFSSRSAAACLSVEIERGEEGPALEIGPMNNAPRVTTDTANSSLFLGPTRVLPSHRDIRLPLSVGARSTGDGDSECLGAVVRGRVTGLPAPRQVVLSFAIRG